MSDVDVGFALRLDSFDGSPDLPLKSGGKIWHQGWEIPTYWAVDASNQCWASCGHGSTLAKVEPRKLLSEARDEPRCDREIRKALGMKQRLPDWARAAKAAGWTPPADWDEAQYDPT